MFSKIMIHVVVNALVLIGLCLLLILLPETFSGIVPLLGLFAGGLTVVCVLGFIVAFKANETCEEINKWMVNLVSGSKNQSNYSKVHDFLPAAKELEEHLHTLTCQLKEAGKQCEIEISKQLAAYKLAEDARVHGEQARCKGLLSAAGTLENAVEGIRSSSSMLDEASSRANSGAGRQQEYISSVVTSMEQIDASISSSVERAESAALDAEGAAEQAKAGELVLEQTIESISTVMKDSNALNERVETLGVQADGIGNIMGVISDIADQTNLLALTLPLKLHGPGMLVVDLP